MHSHPDADSCADILATAVVPWTANFDFDEEMFMRQVRSIAASLTRHIYIFGTAGEGYAVSERQFDHITSAFRTCAQECDIVPMVGVISLSLPTIIARVERCHSLGFRRFQLSLPCWGALSDSEIDDFFAETCGRFSDCHFHHYNLVRTKRLLTSNEYRRLAAAHPNLVGVKSSAEEPAVLAELLSMSRRLRFFLTEVGFAHARRAHDVGLLISIASVNYQRARAFVTGTDAERQEDLIDLQAISSTLVAIARNRFHIDGAFDKMLCRVNLPGFPLRLLPPYASPTEQDYERFRAAIPAGWAPTPLTLA